MRPLTKVGRPRGETHWKQEVKNSVLAVVSLRCQLHIQVNTQSRQVNWSFALWSGQGWMGPTRTWVYRKESIWVFIQKVGK